MNCPNCGRGIPADSKLCPYCGARTAETVIEERPATGPTTRLETDEPLTGPAAQFERTEPLDRPAAAARTYETPAPTRSEPGLARSQAIPMGAVWLIGMGILFLTNTIWPGVLVLVGITSYLGLSQRGRLDQALTPLIFFCGLAVLFYTNWIWPGILILVGIMALLNSGYLRRMGR